MFDDRIGNLQKMLARMEPEGRQRYAADHADDPIAVSMALFVNNIAKEIKEGKRGEPEVQAPVVQQAIQAMNRPSMPPQGVPPQGQPQAPQQAQQAPQQAPQAMPPQAPQQQGQTRMAADGGYMDSRLPEEMGIGALPERSLSNMADGGIVGYAGGGSPKGSRQPSFDNALEVEGITDPRQQAFLKALYGKESGSGADTTTSNKGAVGGMQILPNTFDSVADRDMDINNPFDNMRAGIRYGMQGYKAAKGDPVLAGAYYYSGPDGFKDAVNNIARVDTQNPKYPNSLEYGKSIAQRITDMLPMGSAQAETKALPAALQSQSAKTPAGRILQGIGQNIDETKEAVKLRNEIYQKYVKQSGPRGLFTEQSDVERENAKAIMGRLNSMSPTEMRFVLENGALPQGSSSFQPYDRNRKGNVPFEEPVNYERNRPGNTPFGPSVNFPEKVILSPSSAVSNLVDAGSSSSSSAATPTGAPPAANASWIQTLLTSPNLTVQGIVDARKDIAFLQDPVVDPLKDERQKIVDADQASGLEELRQHRDRVAKQSDPYAKQEERANKQEASVAESAERNPYLALMEAGFAMMAGDSPYAMVNIGKGALVGTKTYREGLALIEKAKEKLTETRDRIDGLRLIRSDLNASEERTILNQNRKTALDGVRFMFEGISKATGDSKIQIENTLNIFTAAETARRLADRQYNTEAMRQGEENARNAQNNAASMARTKLQVDKQHDIPTISKIAAQLRAANLSLSVEQALTKAAEIVSTSATTRADSNELIQNRKEANKQILTEGNLRRIMIEAEKDPVKKQVLIDSWNNRQKEIRELNNISDPAKAKFVGFE